MFQVLSFKSIQGPRASEQLQSVFLSLECPTVATDPSLCTNFVELSIPLEPSH